MGSPQTKNRFGAQNDPRIASKTDLEPAARVISHQKQDLGLRRPSFYGTRVGAASAEAGKFGRIPV